MALTEKEKHNRKVNRRVNKRNQKIKEKYPLFYNQFKTDFYSEEKGMIEAVYKCEQTFERLNSLAWKAAFEVEIYKRLLLKAGKPDIIEKCYNRYYKFHRDIVGLSDDLNSELSDFIGFSRLLVNSYVENKTWEIFGKIINESKLIYE